MKTLKSRIRAHFFKNYTWQLYVFILPVVIYFILFNYAPMYGLIIAFKKYTITKGILSNPWAGFTYFRRFFQSPMFWRLLCNTLYLSFYQLAVSFPIPVAFALILHQSKNKRWNVFVQTVTYAPHFISVVVLVGMLFLFTSPSTGIVNILLNKLGYKSVDFMGSAACFSHIFVWSQVWQNTGYQVIIFIAALTAIDPALTEAATLDGASKIQKIWYIDLPAILPTVATLLLLQVGRMLNVDVQKDLLMQTPTNLDASEIIGTYVYKIGLVDAQFSYATAINLFQNGINLMLLVFVNKISKCLTHESLY